MRELVTAEAAIECPHCHRQFELSYRRIIKGWFWRIRFCPFCGKELEVSLTYEMGYEPDALP